MKASRIAAFIFTGTVIANAMNVAAQQTGDNRGGIPPVTDPVAKELERCMHLSEEAAAKDEQCQAAHKKANDQFFQPPRDYHPVPIQITPGIPEPKLVKPDQSRNK